MENTITRSNEGIANKLKMNQTDEEISLVPPTPADWGQFRPRLEVFDMRSLRNYLIAACFVGFAVFCMELGIYVMITISDINGTEGMTFSAAWALKGAIRNILTSVLSSGLILYLHGTTQDVCMLLCWFILSGCIPWILLIPYLFPRSDFWTVNWICDIPLFLLGVKNIWSCWKNPSYSFPLKCGFFANVAIHLFMHGDIARAVLLLLIAMGTMEVCLWTPLAAMLDQYLTVALTKYSIFPDYLGVSVTAMNIFLEEPRTGARIAKMIPSWSQK